MTLLVVATVLTIQILFDSLLIGALISFMILAISGIFHWNEQNDVFTEGMRMMVQIAVIISIASGCTGVLEATGETKPLFHYIFSCTYYLNSRL